MKPSEIVFNDKISNRDKFGTFVRNRRTELGITLRDMAEKLGISPAYLSDIEKGNRKAPLDHLEQLAALLCVEESEMEFFVDLSGCTHSNWPELNEYLAENKGARDFMRLAKNMGLSGEEVLAAINQIAEEKESTEAEPGK